MEIQGFEDYLIYQDGRVWSKKRKGKFLKHKDNGLGYLRTQLVNKNGMKNKYIHRLVAEHYIPNPENKPQVDHINRIRSDNRVENLRWVEHLENHQNKGDMKNNTTGIKNIKIEGPRYRGPKYRYIKAINGKTHYKSFKTLEDAIAYKNEYEASLGIIPN